MSGGGGPAPVRLQTHVWNPLGAQRALLLHGLGSDGASWWRLASELADDGFLVLAPDLRSHGRSPTAVDHSFAALASDVVLLGEAYDLVVAHSLGAALAAVLLERPCFTAAAVLIDPVMRLSNAEREPFRERLRAEVAITDPATIREQNPRWDEREVQRKALAASLVTPDVVDAALDDNDPWDVTGSVERWGARLEVLAGDPEFGGLLAPELLDTIVDGGRVTGHVVPGCGHSIHRERPDIVKKAVGEVLRGSL